MVKLQIVDILSDDIPGSNDNKLFKITIYGKCYAESNTGESNNAKSIICHIIDYEPYFYLKIPEEWTHGHVIRFLKDIDGNIETLISCIKNYDPTQDLLEPKQSDIVHCKELYGFRCDETKERLTYQFVKLRFSSHTAMSKYSEAIRKKYSLLKRQSNNHYDPLYRQWISLDKDDNCDSHLYESNIHPMIRFIHYSKIQPANWIQVDYEDLLTNDPSYPHVDYVINDIHYDSVHPIQNESIFPFVIASYDIECDSSHGDFPLANKDMKKLAIDIYDSITHKNHTPDQYPGFIKPCLKHAFQIPTETQLHELSTKLDINLVYTKDNKQPSDDSMEMIKDMFEEDSFIEQFTEKKKRDSIIKRLTNALNSMTDDTDKRLQVEGDKVIQIGTVFQRFGETEPYKRHILVIAPEDNLPDDQICSDLEGIEVVCCKNEKQLLLRWKDIIKREDPDYLTGYNIFGFDFAYMIDRMKVYCKCKDRWCTKGCPFNKFMNIGKINSIYAYYDRNKRCKEIKKKTSNFGSLDYNRYIHMDGRIIYDLQKEIEKSCNLESYKLDNVAAHFMRGKITFIESVSKTHNERIVFSTKLHTKEFGHLKKGDYISLRLHSNIGETYFKNNKKYKISELVSNESDSYISITSGYILFNEKVHEKFHRHSTWSPNESMYFKIEWCLMKDDISPQDIFDKHKQGPDERAEVAKYCIQDCELCINLTLALDIIPNNISMANVCWVPQSYIYLRGQGAKIFSLISKECDNFGYRIPTLVQPFTGHEYIKMYKEWSGTDKEKQLRMKDYLIQEKYKDWYGTEWKSNYNNDLHNESNWKPYKEYSIDDYLDVITTDNPPPRVGYEGAIVLDPEPGIYLDDPVGVVDYASLYPSSIIEKNVSHDTLIEDPKYLKYLDPSEYETITYDNYIYEEEAGKITISKKRSLTKPTITCYYLKKQEGKPAGIIPTVVQQLLDQRKATKKRLKNETNEFKKGVLESLQLAYKLVANSVYGQTGARTSPIYKNILAASTTAIGRERIYDAKTGVEDRWWRESEWAIKHKCRPPKVIYGDTDSVFIKWQRFKNDVELTGKEALEFCIECGKDAGKWVTQHMLHKPQDLEYEKTFYPFILVSKKRYVADKFEFDINSCKRNSMGIVLKRRDNAPIVKHVFGNVIEKIMIDKDLDKAVEWLKQTLADITDGKFPMSYFIITKSLRGYYKNPGSIAHKVLADRIGERDPGNKPKAGDRIPYVYHKVDEDPIYLGTYKNGKPKYKKRNILQGDRIEDPEYVRKNNKEIDYKFYITNQIMNPVKQVLDLGDIETETIFKI